MSLFFHISFLIQKEKIKAWAICVFYIDFGIFCKRFMLWKICILAYVSVIMVVENMTFEFLASSHRNI